MSYDPTLPDALFEQTLAARFLEAPGDKFFTAFVAASKIIPQVNRFFWGAIGNDYEFFPESCVSRPAGEEGFHSVIDWMQGRAMPASGILSIDEFVA